MAEPAQTAALREALDKYLAIDRSSLVSRSGWGDINFSEAQNDITTIYEIVDLLNDLPFERLPSTGSTQVKDALNRSFVWIEKIDNFSLSAGNPAETRNSIVTSLRSHQEDLYTHTHNWIPFLAYLKGDIPQQLNLISTSVTQAKQAKQGFDADIVVYKSSFDDILKATREASAVAGVGVFTQDFSNDADKRDEEANRWLNRSLAAATITILVAVGFFFVRAPENQYAVIQFSTSKVVILALLIGITAWCAGNFKANKHQATVSRHKAHALKTFQAFVQASDNPGIKDAVLLETTRAIFTHTQTGYLRGDVGQDGSSRVLEIVKGSTGNAERP